MFGEGSRIVTAEYRGSRERRRGVVLGAQFFIHKSVLAVNIIDPPSQA